MVGRSNDTNERVGEGEKRNCEKYENTKKGKRREITNAMVKKYKVAVVAVMRGHEARRSRV